ncbi:2-oxoglutarate dehydrogenase E1 component [Mangrovibacillus cuniculi]|uniref:2-oxoglutarate dehydrogenase E1 component n=1 Tax=Mangrovibacillus cuniculi TaxID=2593652 RepID=A0A7S8HF57_9BACI|nr:2-oxoglutarate dehydrogenase E1 component [Mangrovibacillus cuniculi]QPC46564.1 2-oxoglutarate dehydrogenase E1 component [Mangrovibacillus cuniculi]
MKQQLTAKVNPWDIFHGPNLGYMMEMYDRYLEDSSSVDSEMKEMFDQWGSPDQWQKSEPGLSPEVGISTEFLTKVVSATKLADNIRMYGHLAADIYPLNDQPKDTLRIDLSTYDLSEEDLRSIPVHYLLPNAPATIKNGLDAIYYLKDLYTRSIAYEFSHVHDVKERAWLREQVEVMAHLRSERTADAKKALLKRLGEVEGFEHFIHRTFVGQKRFSIEGLEMLVPLLDEMISYSVEKGARTVNIGMAHRGRLNVLTHVLNKPYEMVFAEFQHAPSKDLIPSEGSIGITYGWTGDVKYHLGGDRKVKKGEEVSARITLANNPSHLEVVSPVVVGYTRAAQENRTVVGTAELNEKSAYAILIHGDAAFPGQGVVPETLNMSGLKGFQTGGSIHIIANNTIGFTTESADSRSTKYASDTAKGFEVPILHVNADDPDAVIQAAILAYDYRDQFGKDFVIDLIGYRRFGHNEMDEPMVTNPIMYKKIHQHKTVRALYEDKLIQDNVISKEEAAAIQQTTTDTLKAAYAKVPPKDENVDAVLNPPEEATKALPNEGTELTPNRLKSINEQLLEWPADFKPNKKLEKILKRRLDATTKDGKIDWAHAETLAFASILQDGTPIRFSGQDSQRGTFAQRHLVVHNEESGESIVPLHSVEGTKASFAVYNSPLTEGAVVGFEYGYNVFAPETLVLWEAQFGDFANCAQVLFDQFVSSGRAKWGQKSGLVMLLPHGYEGQGPEHSSARMERFLTLAAENNWTVANVSTAGQYFHILRRQAAILNKEEVRPLVIMTPKYLLRHPQSSVTADAITNEQFKPLLAQPGLGENKEAVERLVLCSGKVAIDLADAIKDREGLEWLHIARVEEVYPFPRQSIERLLNEYPNVKELVWVQEEPKNMGAWTFAFPHLVDISAGRLDIRYVGRRRRSSPAEGDPVVHRVEQNRIIEEALTKLEG